MMIDIERVKFFMKDSREQLLGWDGEYPTGPYTDIIQELDARYMEDSQKNPDKDEHNAYMAYAAREDIKGMEGFFVPEENYYEAVLDALHPDDVVYDVGAGDLRFDLLMALKVKRVYAVEVNPTIIGPALAIIGYHKPSNLIPICGNGFTLPVPDDVTVIVNLMIHRKHEFPAEWKEKDHIYCLIGKNNPIIERR